MEKLIITLIDKIYKHLIYFYIFNISNINNLNNMKKNILAGSVTHIRYAVASKGF